MTLPVLLAAVQAPVESSAAPTSLGQLSASPGSSPVAPKARFLGPDGKPLPPEVQRQLEQQFRGSQDQSTALPSPTPPPTGSTDELVVTAPRPRGSIRGDAVPERVLDARDIRAFGASTVADLVDALEGETEGGAAAPDTGPVVLLNGRRIGSLAEIATIPAEAIERMEIFPEDVALRYGFRADQKVVNIVTLERFDAVAAETTGALTTEAGFSALDVAADFTSIREDRRIGLGIGYRGAAALLEAERDVQQFPETPNLGRFRTLLPAEQRWTLRGVMSGPINERTAAILQGRFEQQDGRGLLGNGLDGPIVRKTENRTAGLGATLSGDVGRWQWTFFGNFDHRRELALTDRADGTVPRDEARGVTSVAAANLLLNGPLLPLPTGDLQASIRGAAEMQTFDATARVGSASEDGELDRDLAGLQVNLDIPLSRRRGRSLPGALSVNVNAELQYLSDFGLLQRIGFGLNWSPVDGVNLRASASEEEGAPALRQLGAPVLITPNVRSFDPVRQEVVDITTVTGGNRGLLSDRRHVTRLALLAQPWQDTDFTLSFEYLAIRTDQPTSAFPTITPAIEAAFPERFTRASDGGLLGIDERPVNFLRSNRKLLRWGFVLTRPLGKVPAGMKGAPIRTLPAGTDLKSALPAGSRIIQAAPGSALLKGFETLRSRLFFSVSHRWTLEDTLLPRAGQPTLDLLEGDAIDFRGGTRRHQLELVAGVYKRGLGARLTGEWQGGSRVRGLGGPAGDLHFSSLATFDLNLFADIEQFAGPQTPKWLADTRLSLGVANVFNARMEVRDGAGSTPLSYQGTYLDPLGRVVSLSVRKLL
jgi:hypothetical protein